MFTSLICILFRLKISDQDFLEYNLCGTNEIVCYAEQNNSSEEKVNIIFRFDL